MVSEPHSLIAGNKIFFPLAIVYAIVIIPASAYSMLGYIEILPALSSSYGHAHEMLFGFALAVVAGNQIGLITRSKLALLAGLWLFARVTFLTLPESIFATLANILFASILVSHITPRLFRSAKKLRNQALPMTLTAIFLCSIIFHLNQFSDLSYDGHTIFKVSVLLFVTLMIFMGGRIIAPTIAGQFYRQKDKLIARVQPKIEGAILITMAISVIALILSNKGIFNLLTAILLIVAGMLTTIRILRWRLWDIEDRPDLLCLAAGYCWLPVGLFMYGYFLITNQNPTAALHVITIGALGTLTLNVMHVTWAYKTKTDSANTSVPVWATLLIAMAVATRLMAVFSDDYDPAILLQFAAIFWSSAFILLFIRLMYLRVY